MNTTDVVLAFVNEELLGHLPDAKVTADDDLLGREIVDSLGVMRLITFIEERYSVSVPPEDVTINNFGRIIDIVSYVEDKRSS